MAEKMRRQTILDESTAEILEQVETRQIETHLPAEERKKKKKQRQQDRDERKRQKDRLENRVNWDIGKAVKDRVKDMAKEYGVPASQLAAFLLIDGLRRMEEGNLLLSDSDLEVSNSPRYERKLKIQQE